MSGISQSAFWRGFYGFERRSKKHTPVLQKFQVFTRCVHSSLSKRVQLSDENERKTKENAKSVNQLLEIADYEVHLAMRN